MNLNNVRINKYIGFKKADNGSVEDLIIMDKTNYITESYRQLNNDNHYENLSEPIYPRMAIKITDIFNKLKSTGAIPFTSPGAKTSMCIRSLRFRKRLAVGQFET